MHAPPEHGPIEPLRAERDSGPSPPPAASLAPSSERVGPGERFVVGEFMLVSAWRDRSRLALLAVVVTAGRWWFSRDRDMFHMAPDEPAQLAMARWLAGGVRWSMFDHASWRPGMAVLMAPLFWLTDKPTTIIHGGLLIAAILGGIAAVQLAVLGRRLVPLSPNATAIAAGAIALSASSLSATAFVWAEALVTVCFLASLSATLNFYDDSRLSTALAGIAWAVVGFTAHSRLLPLVPVVIVALGARAWRLRERSHAAAIIAFGAAATVASFLFADWVYSRVWDNPGSSNTVGTVIDRLPRVGDNLRSALGQVWYQLIATAGLTALGAGIVIARGLRRPINAPRRVIRDARLIVVLTAPLVVESIVFMSGRTRTDHRIYGRYNDAVLWPVLLIAVAWVVNLRSARRPLASLAAIAATLGAIVGASVGIDRVAGEALSDSVGVRPMVAGLIPFNGDHSSVRMVYVTVFAAVCLLVLVLLGRRRRSARLLAVFAVVATIAGGVRTHAALGDRLNSWLPATEVVEIEGRVPPGAVLGFRFVPEEDDPPVSWDDQRRRAQLYQFALPDHRFDRDGGVDDDVGPYVFAPLGDPELERVDAELLWRDPKVRIGLWREPAG